MSTPKSEFAYDRVRYRSYPRRSSSPERIATIASLYGVKSPALDTASVLEIGCGAGGNLIPLAERFPRASFIGIDLAATAINEAEGITARLGLRNLTFQRKDALTLASESRRFDYIICHGVFSWVEQEVQRAILRGIKKLLTDDGLCFLSYNVLPGWRMRQVVREAMLYHTREIEDLNEKVSQGKALVQLLRDSTIGGDTGFSRLFDEVAREFEKDEDYYVFHEYLADHNHPLYFHQFLNLLDEYDLHYLADAEPALSSTNNLLEVTRETLESLGGGPLQLEQYLDIIRGRRFRESIVGGRNIKGARRPEAQDLQRFYLSSPLKKRSSTKEGAIFQSPGGGEIRVNDSVMIRALDVLISVWPGRISCEELLKNEVADFVQRELFACWEGNLVEVDLLPEVFSTIVPEYPKCTPLARLQAAEQEHVTSLRHIRVKLEPIVRFVLTCCDGSRTSNEIVSIFEELVARGEIRMEISEAESASGIVTEVINRSLERLRQHGFLIRELPPK